jgi:uncharacterized protein YjaG (DUF416 family)
MKKNLKKISYGHNYNKKFKLVENNNWFIITDWTIQYLNDEETKKFQNDERIIVSIYDDDLMFVHRDNVDIIEKTYNIKTETVLERLDMCFGDWEEFYDRYANFLCISEHLAYELVGGRIVWHIEEMAININNLSADSIKNLTIELLDKHLHMIFAKWFDTYSTLLDIQYEIFSRYIKQLYYAGLNNKYELPSNHDSPRDLTCDELKEENEKLLKILQDNNINIE